MAARIPSPSKQAMDFVVREYNAIEGGKQHLARLSEHLDALRATQSNQKKPARPFILTRVFQAPQQLLWDAWTKPLHLGQWMSPKGCAVLAVKMDFRVGGTYHYGLKLPNGDDMWGQWLFREILAPERLVFVQNFYNADGGMTRHPMATNWPLDTLSTITFSEHAGQSHGTTVVLTWTPINASDEERAMFDSSHASMQQGWASMMEQLMAYPQPRINTYAICPQSAADWCLCCSGNLPCALTHPAPTYGISRRFCASGGARSVRDGGLRKSFCLTHRIAKEEIASSGSYPLAQYLLARSGHGNDIVVVGHGRVFEADTIWIQVRAAGKLKSGHDLITSGAGTDGHREARLWMPRPALSEQQRRRTAMDQPPSERAVVGSVL
jgi:uncharacterized protein YndB with AHSA1/START domain